MLASLCAGWLLCACLSPAALAQEAAPTGPGDPEERLADPDAPPPLAEQCGVDRGARGTARRKGALPSFAVQFRDEVSPHSLISTFVMPGETLELEALLTDADAHYSARADGGELTPAGPKRWRWTAPDSPGSSVCLGVSDLASGETLAIRAFVLVPYSGSETLNGYHIGRYEPKPLRGDPAYRMPRGLIEVTEANRELWVSPHFQLHQFACKQESDFPKYLLLSTRLLLKLESLLNAFQDEGLDTDTLFVMSGYRTPYYNRSIGNTTRYSRHAYGDAADVFVDHDRDGMMDDLNRDGRIDRADAKLLYDIVDSLGDEPWYRPFLGGLGLYGPKPHRGPFIHVDTRGRRARW